MGSVPVPDSHVNSSVLKGLLSVHLPFFFLVSALVLGEGSGELQLFQISRRILDQCW